MKISWDYLKIPPVPYLPVKSSNKAYSLVIELDHTLIYYDKETKILKYRPYIDMFLHKINQFFEIIAFTKAEHKYAEVLIGQI
jgi:TFIIF-interacting CTD phosphatase-like protein